MMSAVRVLCASIWLSVCLSNLLFQVFYFPSCALPVVYVVKLLSTTTTVVRRQSDIIVGV